ncbi:MULTISPECIES: aldo/keto reductase [unclassified Beijerinckia]|uniref:aldo/keto reductase n=1 Tax=unclassified Beijerinckia TaxID=2638183 RepID=UPI000895E6C7|nr:MULTISPECIES: aldo/keto reductase [unclassified Beijerinckia]MDH7795556.1 aryl-alcohol dehydrogenase-like predicted oxidoreductase [Beijerinckia sp. GAS462]SEC06486.1 Predicted oxidoreductase [Beijerinckia sp. 28-YEA-48]
MQDKNLGTSGLRVSVVGLGCNNFGARLDLAGAKTVVHKALDEGVTLFDTADMYGNRGGSELALGEILGNRRKDIVLATKFGFPMDEAGKLKGGSRRYIMSAVEASLQRLKTDWIDLYQYHRPDPLTPIEETLRALDDLVHQGKVRYVGCSNLAAWGVVEAAWTAKSAGLNSFASCQDEYSLLYRKPEADLVPVTQKYGLGILPYYPLAAGMLTGKYKRGEHGAAGTRFAPGSMYVNRYMNDKNWDRVEQLEAFVAARGRTLVELAFSWLASRPTVSSVIAGAMTPEQVATNVKAAAWVLSAEELAEIDKITA